MRHNRISPALTGLFSPDLAERDLVNDAAHNLRQIFTDLAPAEALTRALVSERTEDGEMARFWVAVYTAMLES